jgi:hypothetical protein
MKLSIYKEEEKKEPEKEIRLRLIDENDGGIHLVAVDENGKLLPRGYIFTICEDGRAILAVNINPAIGLQLRKDGAMRVRFGRRD